MDALKGTGGWQTAEMAERYAKLRPQGHGAEIERVWGCTATTPTAEAERISV